MRVIVHADKCMGNGICVLACSEVFTQGEDDGLIHILQTQPSLTLLSRVKQAVQGCPALVFSLEDEQDTSSLTIIELPSDPSL